jgi:hypothetical protein
MIRRRDEDMSKHIVGHEEVGLRVKSKPIQSLNKQISVNIKQISVQYLI